VRADEHEPLVGGVHAHHAGLAVRGAHLPLERLGPDPEALGRAAGQLARRELLGDHAPVDLLHDLRHPDPRHPADVHRLPQRSCAAVHG
jgi:hypothetical protein